jgi:lysophospholipase L1-like esterase
MITFDENLQGMCDEGDTPWWDASSGVTGTLTSSASWMTLSGPASATYHRCIRPPSTNDFILYVKAKAEYASGKSTFFSLRNELNAYRISVAFGYSWVTGAQTLGKIGLIANGGATKFDIATGFDYENNDVVLAFHIDRNRSAINVFMKQSGEWVFISHIPGSSLLNDATRFAIGINNVSSSSWLSLDYALGCRPNMIAIGDSIPAGHPVFDPNPSHYAGNDDNANTWMRYAALAQSNRNNLIVNKGIGGQTSAQIASRIGEATAHKPRVVFLHASANDHQAGVSQASRTTNIQNAVNSLVGAGAEVYLINGTYANSNYAAYPGHAAYMQDWWDNYRSSITGLAGAIDIMSVLASGGVLDPLLAHTDGIHPNSSGHSAIGSHVVASV